MFGYQYVLDVIKNGVTPHVECATGAQNNGNNKEKTKDYKALDLIHQWVDVNNFEKVGICTTLKEAWEILEKFYAKADKEKVLKLQNS